MRMETLLYGGSVVIPTRILLEHGARIEATGAGKETALFNAARDENTETVRLLLEHGAQIEATDVDGWTALTCATVHKNTEVVRLLLEHGAKVSSRDAQNRTVLDYIKDQPDPDGRKIDALLRKYGAK